MMKSFRKTFFSKLFALMAGITFLNMSFILSELKAIGLQKNSSLIASVLNNGLEEESDSSETGGGSDEITQHEFFSLQECLNHQTILVLITEQKSRHFNNLSTEQGHLQIFSPPPELQA